MSAGGARLSPPAASSLTVDAFTFGSTALQLRDENERASFQPQGDDCLSLDIWTRGPHGVRRPVLVFIHGGANVSGSTADPLYDGHHCVRDNDVVPCEGRRRQRACGA